MTTRIINFNYKKEIQYLVFLFIVKLKHAPEISTGSTASGPINWLSHSTVSLVHDWFLGAHSLYRDTLFILDT